MTAYCCSLLKGARDDLNLHVDNIWSLDMAYKTGLTGVISHILEREKCTCAGEEKFQRCKLACSGVFN